MADIPKILRNLRSVPPRFVVFKSPEKRGRSTAGRGASAGSPKVPPQVVGGIAIGTAGTGIYDGFTLNWGDDFDGALDIIGPSNLRGKYNTNRIHSIVLGAAGSGPRNSSGIENYYVDPLHSGDQDRNQGVPVASWADSHVQANSILTMKQRAASGTERSFFRDPSFGLVGSSINTAPAVLMTMPCIFECRMREPLGTSGTIPVSAHLTFWAIQANPFVVDTELEVDWEAGTGAGNQTKIGPNYVTWASGTPTGFVGSLNDFTSVQTLYTFVVTPTSIKYYKDGVLFRTATADFTPYQNLPIMMQVTNVAYHASFSAAEWAVLASSGYTVEIDYMRVWSGTHFKPKIPQDDILVDAGSSFSTVLTTATNVWGSEPTEVVEALPFEANEPGGTYNGAYAGLPSGLTYTAATRTLAASPTLTATAGAVHVERYVKGAGISCEPQKFCVCVGPKASPIVLPAIQVGVAYNYTVPYTAIDVGTLTPKTWAAIGLPTGLSLSNVNGQAVISGTPTALPSSITLTCTNSKGQTAAQLCSIMTKIFTNPEAAAYVARMTVQPTTARMTLIDSLFTTLKSGPLSGTNLLTKCDGLALIKAHDAQAAKLNIMGANYTATLTNTPTFTTDGGYTTNGTDNSYDTNFNPVLGISLFVRNSASWGLYIQENAVQANSRGGFFDNTEGVTLNARGTGDVCNFRLNQIAGSSFASADSSGFGLINRSGANATQAYLRGTAQTVTTNPNVASVAIANGALRLGTIGQAGVFSASTFWAWWAGSSLTANEVSVLTGALTTYFGSF